MQEDICENSLLKLKQQQDNSKNDKTQRCLSLWTLQNKDNKMVGKPLPQDGSYCSWLHGKENKGSMPEKLLPWNGGCIGISRGSEDKDNMLENLSSAQPSFWNKNGMGGAYKAVLVANGECWHCLGKLQTCSVGFSLSFWLASVLKFSGVAALQGEENRFTGHHNLQPWHHWPWLGAVVQKGVMKFALKEFRIMKCSFLETYTRQHHSRACSVTSGLGESLCPFSLQAHTIY